MFLGLLPMLGHGGLELGNPAPGSRYRTRGEIAVTIGALKVCSGDLERGKMLHLDAIESGIHTHPHVAAALVSMYARCGSLAEAHRVFEEMPRRNVVSWNALIQGYAENGQEDLAMKSFVVMQDREGLCPNSQTFVAVLKACTNMATKGERAGDGVSVKEQALEKGMALHSHATVSGFELNEFVANSLVEMYAKSGSMEDASRVFFRMKSRSVVSWTAMILGFAENGDEELALELFDLMLETQSCRPDALTFVAAIKGCTRLAIKEEGRLIGKSLVKVTSLEKGKIVHTRARNSGCQSSIVLESALVDMYSKCGSMVDARRVFHSAKCHNVVSWNSLIQGYVENGEEDLALESLLRMQAEENCQPDARTFVAAFKACGGLAAKENGKKLDDLPKLVKVESLEKGMALHARLAKSTCGPDVFLTNTLVDMYARCRSMQDSQKAFDQSSHHTTVSWNALILGYAENGEGEAALEFFQQMLAAGECPPDCLTYVSALKACNTVAATEKQLVNGKPRNWRSLETKYAIHSQACGHPDVFVANTLVDAYASSGNMFDARRVFESMSFRTLVSWNTLMHAYADCGQAEETLELFPWMKKDGYRPDCRTFAALLKACGLSVTLSIGKAVYGDICRSGFEDDMVLLTASVDMFGKCGSMAEAQHIRDSSTSSEAVAALVVGYSRQGDVGRVLGLYHQMRDEGVKITSNCFVSVLAACSHGGLVETGKKIFRTMTSQEFGIVPGMEHYVCMVDVLGRANQLDEAVEMVKRMPFDANAMIWMTVLAACCKWNNLETGRLAFDRLVSLDASNGAAYTLMANLCKNSDHRELSNHQ